MPTAQASAQAAPTRTDEPKPMFGPQRTTAEHVLVYVFILTPFLALIAAVTLAWGWGLSWLNVGLATGFYVVTGIAVTVGLHRVHHRQAIAARDGEVVGPEGRRLVDEAGAVLGCHVRREADEDPHPGPHRSIGPGPGSIIARPPRR